MTKPQSLADFHRNEVEGVEQQDSEWFREQLVKCGRPMTELGDRFYITCPYHPDSDPSLGIYKFGGYWNCFPCGAGGPWNKLAKKLGMEPVKRGVDLLDEDSVKATLIRSLSKMGFREHHKTKKAQQTHPIVEKWTGNWRGYKGAWLRSYGCIRVTDLRANVLRLGIPIRDIKGEIVSYTCRAVDPEDAAVKYAPMRADRSGWHEKELPAKDLLFQGDLILPLGWKVLVLTEGPLDAMRLFMHGIPSASILGVTNWSDQKRDQIIGCGVEKIYVFMDADGAGYRATDAILSSLRGHLPAIAVTPPKGKDADLLTLPQIQWLKDQVLNA